MNTPYPFQYRIVKNTNYFHYNINNIQKDNQKTKKHRKVYLVKINPITTKQNQDAPDLSAEI